MKKQKNKVNKNVRKTINKKLIKNEAKEQTSKRKKQAKALVLLSGGLDSRLALKIMQEQLGKKSKDNVGNNTEALFFMLPFGAGCCDEHCAFNFAQTQNIKLNIIDCAKSKLLKKYLNFIKKPKYGYGSGINPCVDCRIFMFKLAKQYANKHNFDIVVTGEVIGERPMSQHRKALDIIEKSSGLQGRLLRPLSAKLLPETNAEKKKLIDREKLFSIQGRQRKIQIELAKKYKINYPSPAGGCLLCEKEFAKRIIDLLKHKAIKQISKVDCELLKVGRHFRSKQKQSGKIIVGRDEKENKIIEILASNDKNKYKILQPKTIPGPSVFYENSKDKSLAAKLLAAYSDAKADEEVDIEIIDIGKTKKLIKVKKQDRGKFEKLRV